MKFMSKIILKIPKRTSDNFGDPITRFIGFVGMVKKSIRSSDILEIDLTDTKFISPFLVSGLVHIVNNHRNKGGKCEFVFNKFSEGTKSYLATVRFPESYNYEGSGGDSIEDVFSTYHDRTYTPIVKFPTALSSEDNLCRENILTALNKILKNQLNLSGSFATGIYYLIDELTQNIVDHSGDNSGAIFAQFFTSKNFMDIAIWDNGKGLYQSYVDSGKHNPSSHSEALNFAVYGKSTKDIPESRGFGLSTSRDMLVNGLSGKFFIFSGNAFFIQTAEREEVIAIPEANSLHGCYLALRIPILNNAQFNPYNFME